MATVSRITRGRSTGDPALSRCAAVTVRGTAFGFIHVRPLDVYGLVPYVVQYVVQSTRIQL